MAGILDVLLGDKSRSSSKSYFIGLERGRMWANDYADYFEVKEWSGLSGGDFKRLILPDSEELHFKMLDSETPLEWGEYLRGWLAGVKEAAGK